MEQPGKENFHFYDFKKELGVEIVYGSQVKQDFSRHTHRMLCIGIVELGVRIFLCRGVRYEVIPGQVFIIPLDEEHACVSEGAPHTYRLLLISSAVLHMILPKSAKNSNSKYIFKNLVFDDKKWFDQLMNLQTILLGSETSFLKQAALVSTIGDILQDCADVGKDLRKSNKQYESVKCMQTFIETHYAENFTLEALARKAYLSPYHLLRVFSQIIGIPPHIFQKQVRMRHAKEMLLQGIPIVDVAIKTGFTDQSHFSNVFKKMTGITPGEYSKSFQVK